MFIRENDDKSKEMKYLLCNKYIDMIHKSEDLMEMYDLHKEMWGQGLRNANIGPGAMIRTEDIATMRPEHVYLGGIYEMWTRPLTEWQAGKDNGATNQLAGGRTDYSLVCDQYRKLLERNLRQIRAEIYDHGFNREKVEQTLLDSPEAKAAKVSRLMISDREMAPGRSHSLEFYAGGIRRSATLYISNKLENNNSHHLVLVPTGWEKGLKCSKVRDRAQGNPWTDIFTGKQYSVGKKMNRAQGQEGDKENRQEKAVTKGRRVSSEENGRTGRPRIVRGGQRPHL